MQRRPAARLAATFTLLLTPALAFAELTPAAAEPSTTEPVNAVLATGQCTKGGRVVLSARKLDTGDQYRVTARARNLPEGSVWRGSLLEFSESSSGEDDGYENTDFRTVAVNGGWTVTTVLRALPNPLFVIEAYGPGGFKPDGRRCFMFTKPVRPMLAVSGCRSDMFAGIFARRRVDGGTVVGWAVGAVRPGSTWTVTVSAAEPGDRLPASRLVQRTVGRHGFMEGRLVFPNKVDPAVRVRVLSEGGRRCTVGVWHGRELSRQTPVPQASYDGPLPESPLTADPAAGEVQSLLMQPGG